MKRADHTGHVFDRRPFNAPLTHGPRIVAVKVGSDEIAARVKHISQMIVTVMTGAHARNSGIAKSGEPFMQSVLLLEEGPGFFLGGPGQLVDMQPQRVE